MKTNIPKLKSNMVNTLLQSAKITARCESIVNEKNIDELQGHLAIGHNRYSTSKGSTYLHAQPVIRPVNKTSSINNQLSLAHNGNLPTTNKLEEFLRQKNINTKNSNDSEMMADAIWSGGNRIPGRAALPAKVRLQSRHR